MDDPFGRGDAEVTGGEAAIRPARLAALAQRFGTPLFVYGADGMRSAVRRLRAALPSGAQLFYAVKANPHHAVTRLMRDEGCGAEVASEGELDLALAAGIPSEAIVVSGPAKTERLLTRAVEIGLRAIQSGSLDELERLQAIGTKLGRRAPVALRIDLAAGEGVRRGGWAGPSPFGFPAAALPGVLERTRSLGGVSVIGLHNHQSSQVLSGDAFAERFARFADVAMAAGRSHRLRFLNFGGGFGVPAYADDAPLDLAPVTERLRAIRSAIPHAVTFAFEPGRYLTGPYGWYVARVLAVLEAGGTRFACLDGGIHHMLGLSGALRALRRPVTVRLLRESVCGDERPTELTGPLCTPLDRLAGAVPLPADLRVGDRLAFANCGAYAKQASPLNFLGHDWPAEVMVEGATETLIARRVGFAEVLALQAATQPADDHAGALTS